MQQPTVRVSNRRQDLRRLAKGWTKVSCQKGEIDIGKNIAIRALDVSETGARLMVRESLNHGQELTIHLESPSLPRPLRIRGKVMWCVETAEHTFCVGVNFHKRITSIEMTRFA